MFVHTVYVCMYAYIFHRRCRRNTRQCLVQYFKSQLYTYVNVYSTISGGKYGVWHWWVHCFKDRLLHEKAPTCTYIQSHIRDVVEDTNLGTLRDRDPGLFVINEHFYHHATLEVVHFITRWLRMYVCTYTQCMYVCTYTYKLTHWVCSEMHLSLFFFFFVLSWVANTQLSH